MWRVSCSGEEAVRGAALIGMAENCCASTKDFLAGDGMPRCRCYRGNFVSIREVTRTQNKRQGLLRRNSKLPLHEWLEIFYKAHRMRFSFVAVSQIINRFVLYAHTSRRTSKRFYVSVVFVLRVDVVCAMCTLRLEEAALKRLFCIFSMSPPRKMIICHARYGCYKLSVT